MVRVRVQFTLLLQKNSLVDVATEQYSTTQLVPEYRVRDKMTRVLEENVYNVPAVSFVCVFSVASAFRGHYSNSV